MSELVLPSATIERLYEEKVLVNDNPEYLHRYDDYDFRAGFSEADLLKVDFPRLVIIREFARLVEKYGISARRVLMLNGGPEGDPELEHLAYDDIDIGDYEDDPARFDIHALRPSRDDYDFVLFSQTLEHVVSPVTALRSVRSVLGSGGYAWTSVPTINCQHLLPYNFTTGLTPIGLASLFCQAGFEVVEVGQWGNPKYLTYLFDLGYWPGYYDMRRGVSWRGNSPSEIWRRLARMSMVNFLRDGTRNEFGTPVQTWVLARKGVDEGRS